jgi:hypothetical protein
MSGRSPIVTVMPEFTIYAVGDQSPIGLAIQCATCQLTSYHPSDVLERYCAGCHRFLEWP